MLFKFDCLKNIHCNNNVNLRFYEIIKENMIDNNSKKLALIGKSQGWPYIFNNKTPEGSLINSFLYKSNFFYENDAFIKLHKKIKSKKVKYIIIENKILNQKIKNNFLLEILNSNKEILRYKYYSKIIF